MALDYTPSMQPVAGWPQSKLGIFFPTPDQRIIDEIREYDPETPLEEILRSFSGCRIGIHGIIEILPGLPVIGFSRFEGVYTFAENDPELGETEWDRELWTRESNGHHEAIVFEIQKKFRVTGR